jgi:hypothetical protein
VHLKSPELWCRSFPSWPLNSNAPTIGITRLESSVDSIKTIYLNFATFNFRFQSRILRTVFYNCKRKKITSFEAIVMMYSISIISLKSQLPAMQNMLIIINIFLIQKKSDLSLIFDRNYWFGFLRTVLILYSLFTIA